MTKSHGPQVLKLQIREAPPWGLPFLEIGGICMDDIQRELNSLPPEMLAELSNGLEPGESRIAARFSGIGAKIAGKVLSKGYSNSPLASGKILSPNCTQPRNHDIDTLTPHHAAGVLSVQALMEWFRSGTKSASCNYGIGSDGVIIQGVDEANRPWTTSSRVNDNRAITFEVCNSGWEKDGWPISNKAFEALVALCTDICRRYGKKRLIYIKDRDKALAYEPKADEMKLTRHEWYANTCCPGPSLGAKFEILAARVTAALNNEEVIEMQMTQKEFDAAVEKKVREVISGANTKPSGWAEKEMGEGLKDVKHITDGTNPQGVTTREQTAAMVYRLEKRIMALLRKAGIVE